MILQGTTVMVLGGWGLVGMAVCRKILGSNPKKLVILSLKQSESEDACRALKAEFPKTEYIPIWGDIFVRTSLKDIPRAEVIKNRTYRQQFIEDVFEKFTQDRLKSFFLYQAITEHQPNVIVDCVNSATGLAYQDVYSAYYDSKKELTKEAQGLEAHDSAFDTFERFLSTNAVPQLTRHIQVLLEATKKAQVHTYVKVGTTGTGGMGLNIPYTHSEDKPSGQLLAKSALAGAHSMLLFLMGRTPGCPYIKEIKPAAAIAWKKIGYGEIFKGGKPIPLYDCPPEKAEKLNSVFTRKREGFGNALGENLKSVFIDTGENGIFSADEFFTITAADQMSFVTPEEIAQAVFWEIEGGNSGLDIVGALDSAVMGPTYRAGILREAALDAMSRLQKENDCISVAFEMLGPPHLSKLLYEAYFLKRVYPKITQVIAESSEAVSQKVYQLLCDDQKLRATVLSIGIPILLKDGKTVLRGPEVKIPPYSGSNEMKIEEHSIDEWSSKGWIDLRSSNMKKWQERIQDYFKPELQSAQHDTSSGFHWNRLNQSENDENFVGKIVTHIFITEEKGERIKQ